MAIAAQFTKLLGHCHEMEVSHLRPLMDRMFENADVALLDFAEKAESNVAQSLFFEAMSEVHKRRAVIERCFYAELERSFAEFPLRPGSARTAPDTDEGGSGLSLIETDEVETFVATQNVTAKLVSRIMDRIFALKQRLSVINGGNTIEKTQIPGGPAWLGAAFQQAVEQLELQHRIRLVFIALFDKYVLSRADVLYDEYNKLLIQADILPNLRYEVRKQAGDARAIATPGVPGGEATSNDITDAAGQEGNQTPSELGDEVFARICELMAVQRGQARTSGGQRPGARVSPIRPPGATTGAAGDSAASGHGLSLLGQISNLQNHRYATGPTSSSGELIENIEIDQCFVDQLQATLAMERENIYNGVDRRKVSSADTNVIELVGMLFEYMLKEDSLPNIVKALLSRLHTPLLKVAVIDRSFFTHQGHSARRLLDDMTAAGIHWVDEVHPERGILPRMRELVDKVLLDFKEDVSLFDELLAEFGKAVAELEERASRVEERTNEAASGQEKLQTARARAQQEIQTLCQGKPLASPARDFLQRIIADKLTFILLRSSQGDQSEDWGRVTALTIRIIASVLPPADEGQRRARLQELDELQTAIRGATGTLQQADKEKLLETLFQLQKNILTATDIDLEEVVAAAPVTETARSDSTATSGHTCSAEHQAMLEQLKDLPFGTWFDFESTTEPRKRVKLSWRSTITEKFMFVDQMGVKAAVVCIHELADAMLAGTVRMVTPEKKPFVDRALSAIHRMLDHAA